MSRVFDFVLSAASASQFATDGLPEFALAGRSNVGKSSLINALAGRHKLARTSSRPGMTQQLNFYRVWPEGKPRTTDAGAPDSPFWLTGSALEAATKTGAFYLVDMPGYGFARASQGDRAAWARLIQRYLTQRPPLRAVIQVVDLRHPPSADDVTMWDYLRQTGQRRIVVATKADKVPRTKIPSHLKQVAATLGLARVVPPGPDLSPDDEPLLAFSAVEKAGIDLLWRWLLGMR